MTASSQNLHLWHEETGLYFIGQRKSANIIGNQARKIGVDDQKYNSGRPHDYLILESLFLLLIEVRTNRRNKQYLIEVLLSIVYFFHCSSTQQMEYT